MSKSESAKRWYHRLTPEQKEKLAAKKRARYAGMSPEERQAACQRGRERYARMTAEEKLSRRGQSTGWTAARYADAMREQQARCALCEVLFDSDVRASWSPVKDHDHSTGRPRALLCALCNAAEGYHRKIPLDEEEWGRRVKAYRAKYADG